MMAAQKLFTVDEFAAICGVDAPVILDAVRKRYLSIAEKPDGDGKLVSYIIDNILSRQYRKNIHSENPTFKRWSGKRGRRVKIVNKIEIFHPAGTSVYLAYRPDKTYSQHASLESAIAEAQQDTRFIKRLYKGDDEKRSVRINFLHREVALLLSLVPKRAANKKLIEKLQYALTKRPDYTTLPLKIINKKRIFERRTKGVVIGYVVKYAPRQRYECDTLEEAIFFCRTHNY